MSKGFTLIEMVLTVIILSILGAFTFSVIWQYSNIYASTRGGYVYSEAAAALERMTRELKDAENVDTSGFSSNQARFISFQLTHGTPAFASSAPYWVQYCICSTATPSGNTRALLYRVQFQSYATGPFADQCANSCPTKWGNIYSADLMSGDVMSSHTDLATLAKQGFQVKYVPGNGGVAGPQSDSYEITLSLAANRTQKNLKDGAQYSNNTSITLVSRATPRNFCPYNVGCAISASNGYDRAYNGGYYDEIK